MVENLEFVVFPLPANDAEKHDVAVFPTPHLIVELTPVPVMIILSPPPAATGINKPSVDIPTLHPVEPVKLHTDKSLTNVVHALFAVILLPMMLEFVKPEDIVLF